MNETRSETKSRRALPPNDLTQATIEANGSTSLYSAAFRIYATTFRAVRTSIHAGQLGDRDRGEDSRLDTNETDLRLARAHATKQR